MKVLLTISHAIDALNERVGRTVLWLVLVMALVSAANALARYLFNLSSNAWLELQWYLFAAVFLLCAGYTLLHNEHIRIDIVNNMLPKRWRDAIDVFGHVVFFYARCDQGRSRPGFCPRERKIMDTYQVIILVVVLLFLFGGGGGYYYSRRAR